MRHLTSDFDGVIEIGWLEGGDLARVVSSVGLLGQGDGEDVAVVLLLQLVPRILLDYLVSHCYDGFVTHPQENEALWKRKKERKTLIRTGKQDQNWQKPGAFYGSLCLF